MKCVHCGCEIGNAEVCPNCNLIQPVSADPQYNQNQQNTYYEPPQQYTKQAEESATLGIVSFIFGVLTFVFIPFAHIISIVCGAIAMSKNNEDCKKYGKIGTVLSIIHIILYVFFVLLIIVLNNLPIFGQTL